MGGTMTFDPNIAAYSNGSNDDFEDDSLHGKESARRLFESSSSQGMKQQFRIFLQKSAIGRNRSLMVASLLLLTSNLMVGVSVYYYMLSSLSSSSTMTQGFLQQYSSVLANASLNPSCPTTMVEFANWFADTLDDKRKESFRHLKIKAGSTHTKKFTPVPPQYRKTFYFDGKKISQPIARALRSRGWRKVDETIYAHIIYTYNNNPSWAEGLRPWQRFNFIPDLHKWNEKSNFAHYYKKFERKTGKAPSVYVPESYILTEDKKEIEAFRSVLNEKDGKNFPWVHKLSSVNQGKGITILAPNSKELINLPDESLVDLKQWNSEDESFQESIVQRYICNEMTWNDRKFDVRMYWFVASLDPLIVLYHDGYVRVGNAPYSESSFGNTREHLTSHTGLGAETKATFVELETLLNKQHASNLATTSNIGRKQRSQQLIKSKRTPVEHVRNQFKHALGEMVEIFRDESFRIPDYQKEDPELSAENAFQFYCADFILDKDLDVWFIEPQNGCGLDEDYYFRLEMHASLFNGMVDILEEVGLKQEAQQPLLPLEKSGNWEIIYADGQVYNYAGYERSKEKEGCKVQQQEKYPLVRPQTKH